MVRREREIKKEREEDRQARRGNREVRREKREERREQGEERRGNREVRRDLVAPKNTLSPRTPSWLSQQVENLAKTGIPRSQCFATFPDLLEQRCNVAQRPSEILLHGGRAQATRIQK